MRLNDDERHELREQVSGVLAAFIEEIVLNGEFDPTRPSTAQADEYLDDYESNYFDEQRHWPPWSRYAGAVPTTTTEIPPFPSVGEYRRDERTETIHIAPQHAPQRTLCGRSTTDLTLLDETASGVAATCKTCLRLFRRSP